MMAVEIVGADGHTPEPVRAGSVSAYCHAQGVVTLTCGTYGNVLRFLPPLVIADALLTRRSTWWPRRSTPPPDRWFWRVSPRGRSPDPYSCCADR